jgi:hypothetical protein
VRIMVGNMRNLALVILSFILTRLCGSSYYCPIEGDEHNMAAWFSSRAWDRSECPSTPWLETMYKDDPDPGKLFINIGFNKGYNFAEYAALWQPWSEVDVIRWDEASKAVASVSDICQGRAALKPMDFAKSPTYSYSPNNKERGGGEDPELSRVRPFMLGVDLNPYNLKVVRMILQNIDEQKGRSYSLDAKNLSPKAQKDVHESPSLHTQGHKTSFLKLKLLFAAASNSSEGSVVVQDCGESTYEACKIVDKGVGNTRNAPVISVDKITGRLNDVNAGASTYYNSAHYPIVDILQIDTEGNDGLVLQGARHTLKAKGCRVLIFEYHGNCPWPLVTLEYTIKYLDDFGYDCFFAGRRLWPLTDCWDPLYEFLRWSNVLCVRRTDQNGKKEPWLASLRALVVQPEEARIAAKNKDGNWPKSIFPELNLAEEQAKCRKQ